MTRLSVIIPTFNEETHIEAALRSVAWADERIVVDSGSTDRTVDLAEQEGATVLYHEYENPAAQKNWAIPQATYDVILLLDADERVTPKLQQEIRAILEKGMNKAAYWIPRKSFFMGRWIRYSGWQNDAVIRLIKKAECRYPDVQVHEEIETSGEVGRLKHPLEHYTYRGLSDYLNKIDRYTTWGAQDRFPRTGKITLYHLALKPKFRFIRSYLLKGGILDGKAGFVIACLSAYTVFLRSLKIWRMQEEEKH